MRLHRPIGSLLMLWPTLWALWIAGTGRPDPHVVIVFVLGVVLMRSAGCVINDYADRHVDPHVARTKPRPLAAGKVTARDALALAAVYPFMNRYSHLPQVVLGMAFGWAIPMAFAAQTNKKPPHTWLLF